jgi:hypothetical protein
VAVLLPFHPAWSATWLATLAQERGQLSIPQMEQRLSDEDVRRIAPELVPVLHSWETREREPYLVAAAWGFGRRLKVFEALAEMLERVLRGCWSGCCAKRAPPGLPLLCSGSSPATSRGAWRGWFPTWWPMIRAG